MLVIGLSGNLKWTTIKKHFYLKKKVTAAQITYNSSSPPNSNHLNTTNTPLTTNTNSFLEQNLYSNYKINNNQQFYIDGENILNDVRNGNGTITSEINNPFFYISNSLNYTKHQQQHAQNNREQMKISTPNYINRNILTKPNPSSPSQLGIISSSASVKPLINKDSSTSNNNNTAKTNGSSMSSHQNVNPKSFTDASNQQQQQQQQHHHNHNQKVHHETSLTSSHLNTSSLSMNQTLNFDGLSNTSSTTSTLPPIISGKRINLPLGPHRYL